MISHTMFHLFQILGSEWPALTSASFADSYSDCSITGTLPVLLQQPDSIATPCFPIQPRLASTPITGLPCIFFRGSPGCNPAPPPGAAAPHAVNCSMLRHCTPTTAAARTQQAAESVICARHEFVTLLILELVHMQGWSSWYWEEAAKERKFQSSCVSKGQQ